MSRKRGRDSDSPDSYDEADTNIPKRAATNDPLAHLTISPATNCQRFSISRFLASPTHTPSPSPGQFSGINLSKYNAATSSYILLIASSYLAEAASLLARVLPAIFAAAPSAQAFIVTNSLRSFMPTIPSLPLVLPVVQTRGTPPDHFVELRVLAPQCGGAEALGAIVLVDAAGRVRLQLPFGWGMGRYLTDNVMGRYAEVLVEGVKAVAAEGDAMEM